MMRYFLFLLFPAVAPFVTQAQEHQRYDFPITLTLHFPALATPFRNFDLNFRNIGIGIGTEVTLNHDGTWVQQLQVSWLRNRKAGHGLLAYTQMAWRPEIGDNGFTEIKAGAGYMYAFTPSPAWKATRGEWVAVGHRGKGMLALPVGIAFGTHHYQGTTRYSPFVGYQFMLLTHYNTTVPLVPMTIVQTGLSIAKQ